MLLAKICLSLVLFTVTLPDASAESISDAAERISKARDEKAELEKNQVKIGQQIENIGNLSIEDFLELKAVPDGMDAVNAQSLYEAPQAFDFITKEDALKTIASMRKEGVVLPEDLEEKIKKNPENASQLMHEAFEEIPPVKIEAKEDIAKERKSVIRKAEGNTGFKFKDVLDIQRQMMKAPAEPTGRRRGRRKK